MMCFLRLVFILFVFGDKVFAADKCVYCTTAFDPNCGDPMITGNISNMQCVNTSPNTTMKCMKYVFKVSQRQIITRGCKTDLDKCEDIKRGLALDGNELLSCLMCDDDLCNATPALGSRAVACLSANCFVVALVSIVCSLLLKIYIE